MSTPEDPTDGLRELFTDEQLVKWAAGLGVDLLNRDQLIDSLAVGLSVLLWRNTHLETVHSGVIDTWLTATGRDPLADPEADVPKDLLEEFRSARRAAASDTDVENWDLTPAHEDDEASTDEQRLDVITAQAQAGLGIPDDVMLRANASTTADLKQLLDDLLPGIITSTDEPALGPTEIEDLPEFLWEIYSFFTSSERELQIGDAFCTVVDLIGDYNLARSSPAWKTTGFASSG